MKEETRDLVSGLEMILQRLEEDQSSFLDLLMALKLERNRKVLRDGDRLALENLFKFVDEIMGSHEKRWKDRPPCEDV